MWLIRHWIFVGPTLDESIRTGHECFLEYKTEQKDLSPSYDNISHGYEDHFRIGQFLTCKKKKNLCLEKDEKVD